MRLIASLLLWPMLAFGAANDIYINQRNSADTQTVTRQVAHPGSNGVFGYSSNLPIYFAIGSGMSLSGGTLDAIARQADWAAVSGPSVVLNKPTTVAASGITDAATTAQLATKFNAPTGTTAQYIRGDGSIAAFPTLTSGTVTSITAGAGLNGGTITTTGTISMPNVGTPGSYAGVTTDAQGRVMSGVSYSQASASRSLNTAFQISATRPALVVYSVQLTVTASIAGGQNGDVILEIASDSGFTSNVQTLSISGLGQTYTLAVAIQGVQPQTGTVVGFVPAGYYARLRTVNNTGTPAFSYRAGQETLL